MFVFLTRLASNSSGKCGYLVIGHSDYGITRPLVSIMSWEEFGATKQIDFTCPMTRWRAEDSGDTHGRDAKLNELRSGWGAGGREIDLNREAGV